ncbi:MAG: tetratricopeptide repeat protein [Melioribacter sp.]|uniref:tetratricopeptide repeat protein n=1 Tax=Rosettibacter primus TaxID=3111523 RepID=UPI00247E7F05|nr:tetratricopeptide repeat protein [Melioribacter sp.]
MKYFTVFFLILITTVNAQSHRSLINDGVDLYKEGKFADAEVNFKKGLEKKPDLFQGHFNLGDAYYKQGRYDEAIQSYKNALSFTEDKLNKAKVFHNIGNALLKSQKYQESIEAYKNALKLNPDDVETKYNLSYALNMLKQKQNQNQKNQDKNQNKQNDDKKNNQDRNNQDKQNQQDKEQNKQNQSQQQKNQITKEDAQRILEALKNNEQDLQKKLRKIKGKAVVVDKDW